MNREDITRLAHEAAGFDGTTSLERPIVLYAAMSKDFLDKFADLVASAEREAIISYLINEGILFKDGVIATGIRGLEHHG